MTSAAARPQALARITLDGIRVLVDVLSSPDALGLVEIDHRGERRQVLAARLAPENDEAARVLTSGQRFVNGHALDRYHEHRPDAGQEDVLRAIEDGVDLAPDMARLLTGRRKPSVEREPAIRPERYVLSADRRGIFVVHRQRVVTYLRLGLRQQAFAREHWPADGAPPPGGEVAELPSGVTPSAPPPKTPPLPRADLPLIVPPTPEMLGPEGTAIRFHRAAQRRHLRYKVTSTGDVYKGFGHVCTISIGLSGVGEIGRGTGIGRRHALAHAAAQALWYLEEHVPAPPLKPPCAEAQALSEAQREIRLWQETRGLACEAAPSVKRFIAAQTAPFFGGPLSDVQGSAAVMRSFADKLLLLRCAFLRATPEPVAYPGSVAVARIPRGDLVVRCMWRKYGEHPRQPWVLLLDEPDDLREGERWAMEQEEDAQA